MKHISGVLAVALGLTATFGLTTPGTASAWANSADRQQAADAQVAKIGDPVRYLKQIHEKVADAKSGKYGRLNSSDVRRIDAAERRIDALVEGRTALTDLNASDRAEVFTSQETIDGFATNDGGNRLVCKSIQVSGTRLKTTQCMTKAESEAIAKDSGEATRLQQRDSQVH